MPREIPEFPTDWQKPIPAGGDSYDIQLVTPMFGGGVETRENDLGFPIRPTAIRGHLQFWWRATVGARFETLAELREEQSKIWGSTKTSSQVQVRVDNVRATNPTPCAHFERDQKKQNGYRASPTWQEPFQNNSLPYALFPFQGKLSKNNESIDEEPAACIHRASFRLTIQCPDEYWNQIEAAIWAWVNFGGLGSRTRRGCGGLLCKALAPTKIDDLKSMWKKHIPQKFPVRAWPTLAQSILIAKTPTNPMDAWADVIGKLKNYRQGENVGRNPGQQHNRPGRSRFSEPETIRRITQRRARNHNRLPNIPDNAFPRAEFGLPIVFHFKDQGEPDDTVLYPGKDAKGCCRERMASPLILKPLALNNGQALSQVLLLNVPPLDNVDLRSGKESFKLPAGTVIRGQQLATYANSPLSVQNFDKSKTGSAIQAFLAYARSNGYSEFQP